jgi:hypothetical protein
MQGISPPKKSKHIFSSASNRTGNFLFQADLSLLARDDFFPGSFLNKVSGSRR